MGPREWTSVGPFGIWAVIYWTVVIALIGLVLALPLSIAMALFINEYAPSAFNDEPDSRPRRERLLDAFPGAFRGRRAVELDDRP